MKTLSIIIPVYNEEGTVEQLLEKVLAVKLKNVKKEVIIIDDGSTDGTESFLKTVKDKRVKIICHRNNEGKGSAIRSGLSKATGDIILIQDADLEYDPKDYPGLVTPIIKKESSVVYGSRNLNKHKFSYFTYYLGGKFLTLLINLLYHSKLTDEATCYKVFDANVIKNIPLNCVGFEFCPEITVKLLKRGYNILEVPINYHPRKISEGKKIRWSDGLKAVGAIIHYKLTDQ